MTNFPKFPKTRWSRRPFAFHAASAWCAGFIALCGCSALNPAFVDLIDSGEGSSLVTIPNPPGHVVVAVVNRATVDEQLLAYLTGRGGIPEGVDATTLKPRIRMRLRVTYIDGTFQTIEFITGTKNMIDPAFGAQSVPDLNQNDFDNAVVLCDVASVALEPGSAIEVFLPVSIQAYENVVTDLVRSLEERQLILPQFRTLRVDDADEDGNVTLRRNIGIRDALAPMPNVVCGSVVAVVIDGVLSVPFLAAANTNAPSFDINDEQSEASIGGRYEFRLTVQ